MASRSVIAARLQVALEQIRDTLAKHDPEAVDRLKKAADATDVESVPPLKQEDMVLCYLGESVASLARIVDEQLPQRGRGRPRKGS